MLAQSDLGRKFPANRYRPGRIDALAAPPLILTRWPGSGYDRAGRATPRPLGDRGARPAGVSGFASHNCSQDTAGGCLVAGEEPARTRAVEACGAGKGGCLHAGLLPCCAFFGPGGPVGVDPVWRCDPSPSAPRPGKPVYRTPGPRLPHRPDAISLQHDMPKN